MRKKDLSRDQYKGIAVLAAVEPPLFSHAFEVFDTLFITLQTVNIAAILAIIVLAKRYEHATCASHMVDREASRAI